MIGTFEPLVPNMGQVMSHCSLHSLTRYVGMCNHWTRSLTPPLGCSSGGVILPFGIKGKAGINLIARMMPVFSTEAEVAVQCMEDAAWARNYVDETLGILFLK